VRDALAYCRSVFEIEANSAVDNPLVFPGNPKQPDGLGDVISGAIPWRTAGVCAGFSGNRADGAGWDFERRLERMVNPH